MYWKLFRLIFGFICGYLVVQWIPVKDPFHIEEFFGEFILNPLEFLAGTTALVFGMFAMGGIIRDGFIAIKRMLKGEKGFISDIIFAFSSLSCFILLLPFGIWPAGGFFFFCLIYGMISFSPGCINR